MPENEVNQSTETQSTETTDIAPLESWDDAGTTEESNESEETVAEKEDTVEEIPQEEGESQESEEEEQDIESSSEESEEESEEVKEDTQEDKDSDPDAMEVEVMVDGQATKVAVKDLKANYAGKVAWDRRFQELSVAKKQLETDMADLDKAAESFEKRIADGDFKGAMQQFAEFSGIPEYLLNHKMLVALRPEIERIAQMTPDQYNIELKTKENEYLRKKATSEAEARKQEQSKTELQQRAAALQKSHSISSEEWASAESYLKEVLAADPKLAEKFPLTPENVAGYAVRYKADSRVQTILGSVDKGLLENNSLMTTLVDIALENPDFTDEDILGMVKEQVSKRKEREIASKLKKKAGVKPAPPKKAGRTNDLGVKPLESWDDVG